MGAGTALVAAPTKPVTAGHKGGLTEQPMNAAALAPFARAAMLGRDVRATREAEQDQAALHGRLWVELEAAEATVEAVPVPLQRRGGRRRPCGARGGRMNARGSIGPSWPHACRAAASAGAIMGVWYTGLGT